MKTLFFINFVLRPLEKKKKILEKQFLDFSLFLLTKSGEFFFSLFFFFLAKLFHTEKKERKQMTYTNKPKRAKNYQHKVRVDNFLYSEIECQND